MATVVSPAPPNAQEHPWLDADLDIGEAKRYPIRVTIDWTTGIGTFKVPDDFPRPIPPED